jgi:hypothetical protein
VVLRLRKIAHSTPIVPLRFTLGVPPETCHLPPDACLSLPIVSLRCTLGVPHDESVIWSSVDRKPAREFLRSRFSAILTDEISLNWGAGESANAGNNRDFVVMLGFHYGTPDETTL